MNAQQLAALLNGREYTNEIMLDEEKQAKASGLVVVFGASDDNTELRGAINEEIACWNGGTIHVTSDGLLQNECDNDRCPYAKLLAEKAQTIEIETETPLYTFTYSTKIPHETFEIVENGEPYCRGIVFALADVKPRDADNG